MPRAALLVVDFDRDPALALETAECLRQSFYDKIAKIPGVLVDHRSGAVVAGHASGVQ